MFPEATYHGKLLVRTGKEKSSSISDVPNGRTAFKRDATDNGSALPHDAAAELAVLHDRCPLAVEAHTSVTVAGPFHDCGATLTAPHVCATLAALPHVGAVIVVDVGDHWT